MVMKPAVNVADTNLYAVTYYAPIPQHVIVHLDDEEAQIWANVFSCFTTATPGHRTHPLEIAPITKAPEGEIRYLGTAWKRQAPITPREVQPSDL